MKCPYCSKDMQQGVIKSSHILKWEKKRLKNRFDVYDCAIRLSNGSLWKGESVEAWLCQDCNKIVIDYSSNE